MGFIRTEPEPKWISGKILKIQNPKKKTCTKHDLNS